MADHENPYSISASEANLKSLLLVIPMAVLGVVFYWMVWGWEKILADLIIIPENFVFALLVFISGVLLHEWLHGLAWMFAGGLEHDAIKYGFKLSALAPYAHCKVAVRARAYRFGVVAPGLILGLLPYIVGLIIGEAVLIWFGFIFTLAAGGDFLMLWIIRDIPANCRVEDHPERVGCKVIG
jgi:hypothetical protein